MYYSQERIKVQVWYTKYILALILSHLLPHVCNSQDTAGKDSLSFLKEVDKSEKLIMAAEFNSALDLLIQHGEPRNPEYWPVFLAVCPASPEGGKAKAMCGD